MRNKKQLIGGAFAGFLMLVIILDGKTALQGGANGIFLCIRTVIPSLFPFFILSGILNSTIIGQVIPLLRPLGKVCKIPSGAESLLLLGFLAGYPVGAQLVAQACRDGKISLSTAKRMVTFCNNAGPAFLFGMVAPMFSHSYIALVLWCSQILCSLLVGFILPSEDLSPCSLNKGKGISVSDAMNAAIKTTAAVCGWVIAFRIVLEFCVRWFLWRFPAEMQVLISGLLELSNGCVKLAEISNEGVRFLIASILLSCGGICVTMQTISVSQSVFSGKYFLGKGIQVLLSALLALLVQPILFVPTERVCLPIWITFLLCFVVALLVFLINRKKDVAISKEMMYNACRKLP